MITEDEITLFKKNGVKVSGASTRISINRNYIHTTYGLNCIYFSGGDSGTSAIENICDGGNVVAYGIQTEANGVIIQDNKIINVIETSILVSANNCRIIGNLISTALQGIYLFDTDNICHSNVATLCSDAGVLADSDRQSIMGNFLYNNTGDGIRVEYAADCLINNNTCRGNTKNGINILAGSYNLISNNSCVDNDSGDTNTYDGIYLSGNADRNSISNNVCRSSTGITKQRYGVNVVSGTKNKVMGNILYQNKTAAYNDAGTGTEIDHNQTV